MLAQGIRQGARIRVGVNAAIIRGNDIVGVEFADETGYPVNLPGGVDAGEALHDARVREVREGPCWEVAVGRLLLVWEDEPTRYAGRWVALRNDSAPRLTDETAGTRPERGFLP